MIPVFRLGIILVLMAYTLYFNKEDQIDWDFGFAVLYMIYAWLILLIPRLRELIVLKYPIIIGSCEMLLITYGITRTGGANSSIFFGYLLLVTFFGIVHSLRDLALITGMCVMGYVTVVLLDQSLLSADIVYKIVFLIIFALFLGTVNGKIKKFNTEMAVKDPLTGLFNRQYLFGELDNLIVESERTGAGFSLIVLDVNGFKGINDTKGHLEGDRILQELGGLIGSMEGEAILKARYGGDEFVLVIPATSKKRAEDFAEVVLEAVRTHFRDTISLSMGSAVFPEDGTTAEALFHKADLKMYRDKFSTK